MSKQFSLIDFIKKKRDGGRHTKEEFEALVDAVISGKAADYQLSAWLMAAYLNGLDEEETTNFALALANSGERYSFGDKLNIADKHSTGGVGDKTTLILLPLAASCGATIAKLSGPGLGYTGGTVDKLESIQGMKMELASKKFSSQLLEIGCAISGHSPTLAPAEGKFYRLRDVTGTVSNIQLITASILSKKLAGGASCFVFDVKCGSGAFMKDKDAAYALAKNLVKISKKLGKNASAVITDMEQPLGEWVGNAAEVYEAVEVLSGRGPKDTRKLCVELCTQMLLNMGIVNAREEGALKAEAALDSGAALAKFVQIVRAQGGTGEIAKRPLEILPRASKKYGFNAEKSGFVSKLDALSIGEALRIAGGGRTKLDDKIDYSVAIHLVKKIGDEVKIGDTVLELLYNEEAQKEKAVEYLEGCFEISAHAEKRKLIIDIL